MSQEGIVTDTAVPRTDAEVRHDEAIRREARAAALDEVAEAVKGLSKPPRIMDDSRGEPTFWRGRTTAQDAVLAAIEALRRPA